MGKDHVHSGVQHLSDLPHHCFHAAVCVQVQPCKCVCMFPLYTHNKSVININTLWNVVFSQKAPLHSEFHPHAALSVLHFAGCFHFHQRCSVTQLTGLLPL